MIQTSVCLNLNCGSYRKPKNEGEELPLTLLGPVLVGSIDEKSLAIELERRAIPFKRQLKMELNYKGVVLNEDSHLDLIIENKVVVELTGVRKLAPALTPNY